MYDARKPRILVSASGQCTGPYYTGETTEYVLKADADLLAEALEEIIGAMVEPDDEPNSILIQIGARAEGALFDYEEGNTTK